jgi:hypothetical protein
LLLLLLCTRRGSVVEEAAAALFSFEGKPRSRGFAPKLSSSSLLFSLGRPHAEPRVPRRVLGVGHVVPHVGDALFARADLFREQGGARDGAGDEHSEHDAVLRGAERDGHGPERAFGSGFCFVSLSFLSRERRLGRRRRSRFVHGGKQREKERERERERECEKNGKEGVGGRIGKKAREKASPGVESEARFLRRSLGDDRISTFFLFFSSLSLFLSQRHFFPFLLSAQRSFPLVFF